MAAPIIIDTGVVLPWAAVVGILVWLMNEVRKEWKSLKSKVDGKVNIVDCADKHKTEVETEKETRIRISEAVRQDREVRHEGN